MFAYWLLFSIFASGALANSRKTAVTIGGSPIFIAGIVLVGLAVGLRYQVGGDWFAYIDIFVASGYTKLGNILTLSDPGYVFLNWAVYNLGYEIWPVNLFCATVLSWGIYRFSEQQFNPWLMVTVAIPYLIIVVAMGYTRQAVAIGFVMAGIAAFQRGAIKRFLIYAVLGAAFHKSAIIIVPLVILSATRNRFAIYATGAALAAALFLAFLGTFLDLLLVNYIESEMSSSGTAVRVAMNVVPAILFLFFQRRFALSEQDRKLWRNFSLAALVALVGLAVLPSTTVVDRLALYLIPLQLVVLSRLPNVFSKQGRSDIFLTILVIVYSAAIQFTWLNYAEHSSYWLPYRVFLFLD